MPAKTNDPIRVGVLGQGRSGLDIHSRWFQHSPRKYQIIAIADALADHPDNADLRAAVVLEAVHLLVALLAALAGPIPWPAARTVCSLLPREFIRQLSPLPGWVHHQTTV